MLSICNIREIALTKIHYLLVPLTSVCLWYIVTIWIHFFGSSLSCNLGCWLHRYGHCVNRSLWGLIHPPKFWRKRHLLLAPVICGSGNGKDCRIVCWKLLYLSILRTYIISRRNNGIGNHYHNVICPTGENLYI